MNERSLTWVWVMFAAVWMVMLTNNIVDISRSHRTDQKIEQQQEQIDSLNRRVWWGDWEDDK